MENSRQKGEDTAAVSRSRIDTTLVCRTRCLQECERGQQERRCDLCTCGTSMDLGARNKQNVLLCEEKTQPLHVHPSYTYSADTSLLCHSHVSKMDCNFNAHTQRLLPCRY